MSTYILVHGAWHGGWCWEQIIPRLQQFGHQVIAPDLPGHGSDSTPFPQITLQSYVDQIVTIIDRLQSPVILVGHSFGGIVISQVSEYHSSRIAQLIYVAGFLPQNGDSFWSLSRLQKPTRHTARMQIDEDLSEYTLGRQNMQDFAYHQTAPEAFKAIEHRFQSEPLQPLRDTVKLSSEGFGATRKRYIVCQQDKALLEATQRKMVSTCDCEVFTLDSDHTPIYSDPDGLVELLS